MPPLSDENESAGRRSPDQYQKRIERRIRASHRRILREKAKTARDLSTSDVGTMGVGTKDVYLGNDTSLDSKYGDKGTSSTGFRLEEISDLDADFTTADNEAYAEVGSNQGEGSLTAWAYVGRSIEVQDDSGFQDATFTFHGDLYGSMAGDGGSNYVKVELTVEDHDDSELYDEQVFEKSTFIGSISKDSLTDSLVVPLEAGHIYGVKAEVLAEITAQDVLESNLISDFHENGTPGYGLGWTSVDIQFP